MLLLSGWLNLRTEWKHRSVIFANFYLFLPAQHKTRHSVLRKLMDCSNQTRIVVAGTSDISILSIISVVTIDRGLPSQSNNSAHRPVKNLNRSTILSEPRFGWRFENLTEKYREFSLLWWKYRRMYWICYKSAGWLCQAGLQPLAYNIHLHKNYLRLYKKQSQNQCK